eukprot:747660-Hanusia_phi.AAC.2
MLAGEQLASPAGTVLSCLLSLLVLVGLAVSDRPAALASRPMPAAGHLLQFPQAPDAQGRRSREWRPWTGGAPCSCEVADAERKRHSLAGI